MFSFFERKQPAETFEPDVCDLSEPIPSAIVVTASIIDSKLDACRDWNHKARIALKAGDLHKHNGFLCLAKKSAEQAIALMESADLLREEILNQQ